MLNDFWNPRFKSEGTLMDKNEEFNFNRIQTFKKDTLLYDGQEYIQRDFQFNTPLHYFKKDFDHEIDQILNKVFESVKNQPMPIADKLIHAMMFKIIERPVMLRVFHDNFIHDMKSMKHKINIVEEIEAKNVPRKSDKTL